MINDVMMITWAGALQSCALVWLFALACRMVALNDLNDTIRILSRMSRKAN